MNNLRILFNMGKKGHGKEASPPHRLLVGRQGRAGMGNCNG
jgi:hypothetical protein